MLYASLRHSVNWVVVVVVVVVVGVPTRARIKLHHQKNLFIGNIK